MLKARNSASGQGKNVRASTAYTAIREYCEDIFNAAVEQKGGAYG